MAECPFCKEFQKILSDTKYYTSTSPERYRDTVIKLNVCMRKRYSYNGDPDGSVTYSDHPLNFCPSCGKKLEIPLDGILWRD